MTPLSRMELASSTRPLSEATERGWKGEGSMESRGM
jgi:hypothetical protein